MRIGVRRLRSLLVLFDRFLEPHASNRFQDELQRLGQVLGAARDWDVVLGETLPCALKGANADWIERWRALTLERQHSAHEAAKKAILEAAFTNFVLAFQAWSYSADSTVPHRLSDRPLVDAGPGMLSGLARKVNKRLAASDTTNPTNLHSLRKSAKRLRYAIEFFEGLYGEKAEHYHKRCNKLQKRLGDLNDLTTLTRLAEELTQGRRIDLAPATRHVS
jgi:CHAD domain-containing protein